MVKKNNFALICLVQAATVCVFAGRAWQHLFWDVPYRELFWNPLLMKGLVEHLTSWTWQEYLTNLAVDKAIQIFIIGLGVFYGICALAAIFLKKQLRLFGIILGAGGVSLILLALLYTVDNFFHVGQFFEYALQFGSPFFLLFACHQWKISSKLAVWMKIAVALTFSCHGLYAVGYYPRPGIFMEMTMRILGISEKGALYFLNVAGILDFVVALGIFLPAKWGKWVLLYAAGWGLATSLARVAGNFYWDFPLGSLHQWVHEAVLRLPHFFIPLALYFFVKTSARVETSPTI